MNKLVEGLGKKTMLAELNILGETYLKGNLLDLYEADLEGAVRILPNFQSVVARARISYHEAENMLRDNRIFAYKIAIRTYEVIKAIQKKVGSLQNRVLIAERPGRTGIYFIDCEDWAGVELRYYLEEVK